jgi:hypothetical protein
MEVLGVEMRMEFRISGRQEAVSEGFVLCADLRTLPGPRLHEGKVQKIYRTIPVGACDTVDDVKEG